ncbi:MAG: Uma2 family endonuclease [Bacteroidota bacterium]
MTYIPVEQSYIDPFIWTIERYHKAIKAGVLTEYDKVELLFGQLSSKMPIGDQHARCVEILMDYFRDNFGKEFRYRSENPVTLPGNSEPEPDFVVSKRYPKGQRAPHPSPPEIYIVIEVADSTIDKDRYLKAKAYAIAEISEYWIINLSTRKLEFHTQPSQADARYEKISFFSENESFVSLLAGETAVEDLLPPAE